MPPFSMLLFLFLFVVPFLCVWACTLKVSWHPTISASEGSIFIIESLQPVLLLVRQHNVLRQTFAQIHLYADPSEGKDSILNSFCVSFEIFPNTVANSFQDLVASKVKREII